MARRRARGTPKPKTFDEAFSFIDTLENSVITRMVVPDFTVDRALHAMFLEDTVTKLRAAWPLTRALDQGSTITEALVFALPALGASAVTATVMIDAKAAKILVPEKGNVQMEQVLRYDPLVRALQETHVQHLRFETVRRAVRWLNDYATVGAARHYCPWLTSILPADHPFQKVDGVTYREPAVGLSAIMPTMRECASIMAEALLAHNPDVTSDRTQFRVCFVGHRDAESYTSQVFGLI